MSDASRFTDEQLTAFLDGERQHTPYTEIEAAMKSDPSVGQRLRELEIDRGVITDSMQDLLSIAPDAPELPEVKTQEQEKNSGWLRANLIAAAVSAIMLFGGVLGYSLAGKETNDWHDYVAAYHSLYINNTLAHVNNSESRALEELERVGSAIGKNLSFETLQGMRGLDYKRAQILGFEGKPLAQMTFLSKMGNPIALCIIRSDVNGHSKIENFQLEGMASASWSRSGYEYLIIGGKDSALIEAAAAHFAARI